MNKITGNEPIQPIVKPGFTYQDGSFEESSVKETGLTIRQHFAAMAMNGVLSCSHQSQSATYQSVAKEAVEYADALIAELNKPTTNEPATI